MGSLYLDKITNRDGDRHLLEMVNSDEKADCDCHQLTATLLQQDNQNSHSSCLIRRTDHGIKSYLGISPKCGMR